MASGTTTTFSTSLDANTEAGRKNLRVLSDQVDALQLVGHCLRAGHRGEEDHTGGDKKIAADAQLKAREDLLKLYGSWGFAKSAVEAYLAKVKQASKYINSSSRSRSTRRISTRPRRRPTSSSSTSTTSPRRRCRRAATTPRRILTRRTLGPSSVPVVANFGPGGPRRTPFVPGRPLASSSSTPRSSTRTVNSSRPSTPAAAPFSGGFTSVRSTSPSPGRHGRTSSTP